MKTGITLLLFILSFSVISFSQNDTNNIYPDEDEKKYERTELLNQSLLLPENEIINQLDSNGKKDGKWIEYLNDKWKVLKDSNHAVYCRFVYYDHGVKILLEMYDHANNKLEFTGDTKKNSNPILLDGEYKWYDRKGRLLTDAYYQQGKRVWFKGYTWGIFSKKLTGKKIHEFYDFTRKYNGQPHTCYLELSDKKGVVTIYYINTSVFFIIFWAKARFY